MAEATTGRLPTLDELRARRDKILEIASRHGRDLLGYEIDVGTEVKPRLLADVDAEAVPL